MDVDVTYEGLMLMRGATLTTTPNGPFIGLSAPMPVGTNLVLKREGASCTVRVARVEEGASAGIFIAPLEPIERLMPGAGGEFAPPEPPPAPAVMAEAPAAPPAAAEPAEILPAPEPAGASAPEAAAAADASPPEHPAVAVPETAPVPEAATPPATETTAAATAATAEPLAATEAAAPAVAAEPIAADASEPAPLEPPPESKAPPVPEAASGAVAQEMDPRIVTAPVAAADILQEMSVGNTGPIQAPKKSEGARDSDGDAGKKGRRKSPGRGGKKR